MSEATIEIALKDIEKAFARHLATLYFKEGNYFGGFDIKDYQPISLRSGERELDHIKRMAKIEVLEKLQEEIHPSLGH
jgi:hypothetical protein